MPADPRLMALPALRKLAEEEARDIWTRHVRLFALHLPDMQTVADPHDASDGFFVTVEAQVERLADLSRPASRDAVARLVAEQLGLTCGATAPNVWRYGGDDGPSWKITADGSTVIFASEPRPWHKLWACPFRYIPGISAVTDPTEALTLIALAVLS